LGAFARIRDYRRRLGETDAYFDRLRIVNEALGPHWVFRLADAVGLETIQANRPSWYRFYVEDHDGLHCPLDPGAPETETYLGRRYSDMDMAFYAGMGFDGYRLALQTARHVDLESKEIEFDGRYRLVPTPELKARLDAYDTKRFVPKEEYYAAYGDALSVLHEAIDRISVGPADEEFLERVAAGCLIVMCGGHHGCKHHVTDDERYLTQMESLIIFTHARNVIVGAADITASVLHALHAVR
jgi:hypothetical protein